MKIGYETKEECAAAIGDDLGGCIVPVWISKHYAHIDGVEGNKWYVFNNVSKKLV